MRGLRGPRRLRGLRGLRRLRGLRGLRRFGGTEGADGTDMAAIYILSYG